MPAPDLIRGRNDKLQLAMTAWSSYARILQFGQTTGAQKQPLSRAE